MTATPSAADSVETLVRFGRALRAEGVPAGPDRVTELCRAAALLPADDLYWAGRATLLSRPDHIPIYDAVFGGFFGPPTPSQGEGTRELHNQFKRTYFTTRRGRPQAPGRTT